MNNTEPDFDHGPGFPEPFESGWMDIGSRTTDPRMHFTLEVDDSGFNMRRDYGKIPVSDLFGELSWWPTERAWQGWNASLLGSLDEVASKVQLECSELLEMVREELVCHGYDEIDAYIADEQSQALSGKSLRSRYARLVDDFRIPGLPSDDIAGHWCEGSRYRGLELSYGSNGWSATLWEPDPCDEMFLPEKWSGDTLDQILCQVNERDNFPWTREELVEHLLESDPRWQHFINTDFSIVEEPEPKSS